MLSREVLTLALSILCRTPSSAIRSEEEGGRKEEVELGTVVLIYEFEDLSEQCVSCLH